MKKQRRINKQSVNKLFRQGRKEQKVVDGEQRKERSKNMKGRMKREEEEIKVKKRNLKCKQLNENMNNRGKKTGISRKSNDFSRTKDGTFEQTAQNDVII